MNAFLFFTHFLMPCAITTAVLWICYRLLFGNSNRFQFNRSFLLTALLFALALPVISSWMGQITPQTVNWKEHLLSNTFWLNEISITANNTAVSEAGSENMLNTGGHGFNFWQICAILYLVGVGITSLLFSFKLFRIIYLLISSEKEKRNGYTAVFTQRDHGSFSFLNYAFFPDKNTAEEIVRHEISHIEHHHSFDILFVELMIILQWFNPFIYLYKKELQSNHEYTADQDVLSVGTHIGNYMQLILQQCTAVDFSGMSNNFSLIITKKRIKMMTRNDKTKGIWWKLMTVVPVLAILLLANLKTTAENTPSPIAEQTAISTEQTATSDNTTSVEAIIADNVEETTAKTGTASTVQSDKIKPNEKLTEPQTIPDDSVYNKVEVMAEYPGGFEKMGEFLGKNIVYPEEAKEKNIQGTVLVSFVVEKNGKITDAKVVRGIGGGCDEEALRVVNAMPKWKPGKQNGKNVRVQFALPIKFKLQ